MAELDEKGKQPFSGPFTFEPLYPTYLQPPRHAEQPVVSREVVHESGAVPNGVAEVTKTVEVSELPDGSKIIHRKEEYVVMREYSRSPEAEVIPHPAPVPVPVAVEHPHRVEETHSAPIEPEPEPQNHHAVELSRKEEVNELPSHIPEPQAENHIEEDGELIEHHERDVHLENGHAHIVDEVLEGADGSRTHRIIEDAEYESENGIFESKALVGSL